MVNKNSLVNNLSEELFAIGARLSTERHRLGFSQESLAKLTGKTKRSLIKYEKGETFPDAAFLLLLYKLGFNVSYISTGEISESALAADEALLLMDYRALGTQEKLQASVAVRQLGLSGSASAETASSDTTPSAPSASGAVISHNTGDDTTINTGTLINIGLDDGVKPPAKRRTVEKKKPAK
ncbi:hypothetical protein A9J41_00825 [Laribacter hongkongensis]|nr:hypothetical protein [Laribacter hongkongensis]